MTTTEAVECWRELLADLDRTREFPVARRRTARALKAWFDGLLGEGWERAEDTLRPAGAGPSSRILGLRAWWPYHRPADGDPQESSGSNLQLQLVIGPAFWGVQQEEALRLREQAGVRELERSMFLLQDGEEVLQLPGKDPDERSVWFFLAWRLPPSQQRVPASLMTDIELRMAACFKGHTVVRLNGDCQHAMNSILMVGPACLRLPDPEGDLTDFLTNLEHEIRRKSAWVQEIWANDDLRQELLACSARSIRAQSADKPAETPPSAEAGGQEEDLGAVGARLLELLQAGLNGRGWTRNVILHGPPGTGKTWVALKAIERLLGSDRVSGDRFVTVVFHPAYEYDQFIGGVRVRTDDLGATTYRTEPGVFTRLAERAASHRDEPHVLLIDEINRGNLPKLLGELLLALEYRDRPVELSFRSDPLVVPPNLLIVGTMNTADRSIGSLDAAVRRRFAFLECPPDPEVIEDPLRRAVLERINASLRSHAELDGLALGHSYLMGGSRDDVSARWTHQVVPLLREYARYAAIGRPGDLLPTEYQPVWESLTRILEVEARRAAHDEPVRV